MRNEIDIKNAFWETMKVFKRLPDLVIYNSGAINYGKVSESSLKKFDLMHDVNDRGCLICIKNCLTYMTERQEKQRIIVISPPIYQRFFKGKTPYSMTKVAMTVLMKGLSFELKNTNTSIVSLWPATGIQSAATERFKSQNGEDISKLLRTPKIFADAVVGIAKDEKI